MTGKELIDEILKLGLKSQTVYPVEPSAIFVDVNRAIEEVNRLCPVLDTVQILHFPISPTVFLKGITVRRGGEELLIDASGAKSLAFAVSGTGKCTISSKAHEETYVFEWQDAVTFKIFSGLIKNMFGADQADITLVFSGEHTYMIKDLSVYDQTISDLEEDVEPYNYMKAYDLASPLYAGKKFLDFASLPVRYNDTTLNEETDYGINESSVLIPTKKPGVYEVQYLKRPEEVTEDNKGNEIEIDPQLEDLLALRAAYYFYMITDREVAERCNNEYLRLYAIVTATLKKVRTPVKFRERRGWV